MFVDIQGITRENDEFHLLAISQLPVVEVQTCLWSNMNKLVELYGPSPLATLPKTSATEILSDERNPDGKSLVAPTGKTEDSTCYTSWTSPILNEGAGVNNAFDLHSEHVYNDYWSSNRLGMWCSLL